MGSWPFPVRAPSLLDLRNIRSHRLPFLQSLSQQLARQLDTKVYNYIVSLVRVSAFSAKFREVFGNEET